MLTDSLATALISGGVSIFVGLITFISTRFVVQAKVIEYERNISNKYQEKLYEKRIDLYPQAFSITSGINVPPKEWKYNDRVQMLRKRDALIFWLDNQAGLIVSDNVIAAARELIKALSSNYGEKERYQKEQLQKIVDSAINFRKELRHDISILHHNDLSRNTKHPY